ncbi:MAG: SDH family Clp fold serine proteinase [Anaerolineales bacterium]
MDNALNIIWILILLQAFIPFLQKRILEARRKWTLRRIEQERDSRAITLIHRQEAMMLLGFPFARYIDIEDSEQVLRAIRLTPSEMPINLILHTPGGLVLASEQIACALKRHRGEVTVFVPHYAMSGGTLVALAADQIVMDSDAVLGPVDPQMGSQMGGQVPAASVLKALEQPNPNREDQTLILGDVARKAITQVHDLVYSLIEDKMPEEEAEELAQALSQGRWTHDYPISFEQSRKLGLPVSDEMPEHVYTLMNLYPQTSQRRPSVEFIPMPYRTPDQGRNNG